MKPTPAPIFPRLNQLQMAEFISIDVNRLVWAGRKGIVSRDEDGWYRPEVVTHEWLTYERSRSTKSERKSTLERERTRLTRAKAEISELRLGVQRKQLMEVGASTEILRAACVRLRSKFSASSQRIARGAFHANSLNDALSNVRAEYDLLLSELSNLETAEVSSGLTLSVVKDDAIAKKLPAHDSYAEWCRAHDAVLREVFTQQQFLSVTEWAAQNRFLTGAESGRYNPERCPYQSAIQDCFCDPEVREITWQSAERVGKSTVASNVLGYVIDRDPTSVLWVMPSREGMADLLKDDIEPMILASPTLTKKVNAGSTATGRTNNIRRKTFSGGVASFVGGGSASPLAFRTVRVVVLDEVDKLKVLPNEGDADALASKRVSTYGTDFKIFRFSKPTLEGESRIHRHFLRGTASHYYHACPDCGEFQELSWRGESSEFVLK
jgi:Phage terminase large subunit (GpA)